MKEGSDLQTCGKLTTGDLMQQNYRRWWELQENDRSSSEYEICGVFNNYFLADRKGCSILPGMDGICKKDLKKQKNTFSQTSKGRRTKFDQRERDIFNSWWKMQDNL